MQRHDVLVLLFHMHRAQHVQSGLVQRPFVWNYSMRSVQGVYRCTELFCPRPVLYLLEGSDPFETNA